MDDDIEMMPLLSYPTTTTIADAIDDLASHIVATSRVLGVDALMGDLLDQVAHALAVAVSDQIGNE